MRALVLIVWLGGLLAAQVVAFQPLPPAVIEERLRENRDKPDERKAVLQRLFQKAGCPAALLTEQPVSHTKLPNLICTLPGTGDHFILVGAHYDHVTSYGQGVVDNWSGAALLSSLYETLKDKPLRHTFVFIGFTDEEKGLVGSRFYAQQMSKEEIARTQALINLDTLGLAPTEVWLSHADSKLAGSLSRVAAAMKLPLSAVNVEKVGTADSESFEPLGIPRITIHSVTQENFHILHSVNDKLKAIKLADYYDTYRLLAAYLVYLDQALTGEAKP